VSFLPAELKAKVSQKIIAEKDLIYKIALDIGENPELGLAEFKASALLSDTLQDIGFEVERGVGGLKTAFRASLGTGGPNIAVLLEYDALPDLGHACGHNLIAAGGLGAALGLAPFLAEMGGQLTVLGTPAEETAGGKAVLVEQGLFHSIAAAMMWHPSCENLLMSTSTALDAYEFTFLGRAAHAADSPWAGINALDGVIQLFNGVNALREHLADGVRIHGIITDGGKTPNIVPAAAKARFYLRAPGRRDLDEVVEKVKAAAQGAALISGTQVEWRKFENSNDNLKPNRALALAFGANLERLGVLEIEEFAPGSGSSDMGNVSQVVPAIHPYLSIGEDLTAHTAAFARASISKRGLEVALLAAQALAYTAVDLYTNDEFFQAVQKEFETR